VTDVFGATKKEVDAGRTSVGSLINWNNFCRSTAYGGLRVVGWKKNYEAFDEHQFQSSARALKVGTLEGKRAMVGRQTVQLSRVTIHVRASSPLSRGRKLNRPSLYRLRGSGKEKT